MMIREKSSRSRCGEFEVPIICAASSCRNFKFKNRTRIIKLPVPLLIPKFAPEVPRVLANFGIGALISSPIRSEQQRGGDQGGKPDEQPEQESSQRPPARAPALQARLAANITDGWERAAGKRALALDHALRHIFRDRIDDLDDVAGFRQDLAAIAGVLQESVDTLVAAHIHMGDRVDPQPRRFATADPAIKQIDRGGNFLEQWIERLVENFKP